MNMDFDANKTEVIKESTFGGTDFRDIYSGVNRKWYRKLSEEFDDFKNMVGEVLLFKLL